MSQLKHDYIHGYSDPEQQRLLEQSEHWKPLVTLVDFPLSSDLRLLDIGCAVGANLVLFAREFPGIRLAGIDREATQIDAARENLSLLPQDQVDLRVGVGEDLPWPDGVFDRVFIMWLFEHVREPVPILREAHRVLRPGGTVSVIETDYDTYLSLPESEATKSVFRAFREHFVRFGQYQAGRKLDEWLSRAGFDVIEHRAFPIHFSAASDPQGLRRHMEYTLGYIEPTFDSLEQLGFAGGQLREGARQLREVWRHPEGDFIHVVFRGTGRKNVT